MYEKTLVDLSAIFITTDAQGNELPEKIRYVVDNSTDKIIEGVMQDDTHAVFPHAGIYRIAVDAVDSKGVRAEAYFSIGIDYKMDDYEDKNLVVVSYTQRHFKRTAFLEDDEHLSFIDRQSEWTLFREDKDIKTYQGSKVPTKVASLPGYYMEPFYFDVNGGEIIETFYEPEVCYVHITDNFGYDNTVRVMEGMAFTVETCEKEGFYSPQITVNNTQYTGQTVTITPDFLKTTISINYNYTNLPTSADYEGDFDAKDHAISVSPSDNKSTVYYSENEKDWTTDTILKSDAGTYNVYYKIDTPNREEIKGTNTITINKILPVVTAEGWEGEYDEQPHSITVSANAPSPELPFDVTISYSEDGENWTTEPIYKTEPGKYTIYYKIEAPNYETVEESQIINIIQLPGFLDIPGSAGSGSGQTCIGKAQTFTVSRHSGSRLEVKSSNEAVATVSVSGNTITVSPKAEGSCVITVTSTGNLRYKDASIQITSKFMSHEYYKQLTSSVAGANCMTQGKDSYRCSCCGKTWQLDNGKYGNHDYYVYSKIDGDCMTRETTLYRCRHNSSHQKLVDGDYGPHVLRASPNMLDSSFSNRLDCYLGNYHGFGVTNTRSYYYVSSEGDMSETHFRTSCSRCGRVFGFVCEHETRGGSCWKCGIAASSSVTWATQSQIAQFGSINSQYRLIDNQRHLQKISGGGYDYDWDEDDDWDDDDDW